MKLNPEVEPLSTTGKLEDSEPARAVQLTNFRRQPWEQAQDFGKGEIEPASPTASLGQPNEDENVFLLADEALIGTDSQKEAAPVVPPVQEQITPRALLAGLLVVFLLCIMTHRASLSTGSLMLASYIALCLSCT